MTTPNEIAEAAVKALDSKNAHDIKLLRTTQGHHAGGFFILCTAASSTQFKTLATRWRRRWTRSESTSSTGGAPQRELVLLDYGCVVVHLFMEEARQFYNLERLWADAEEIDVSALLAPTRDARGRPRIGEICIIYKEESIAA
jgi:ribosome-associated protein